MFEEAVNCVLNHGSYNYTSSTGVIKQCQPLDIAAAMRVSATIYSDAVHASLPALAEPFFDRINYSRCDGKATNLLHTGYRYLRFYPGIENLILSRLSYPGCHVSATFIGCNGTHANRRQMTSLLC